MQYQGLYLEHFGIKGMRWGHRKPEHGGDSRTTRRVKRSIDIITKERDKSLAKGRTESARKSQMDIDRYQKKLDWSKSRDARDTARARNRIARKQLRGAADAEARKVIGARYGATALMLGQRGAQGVARRMTEKQMSYQKAYRREFGKQLAINLLVNAALVGVISAPAIADGIHQKAARNRYTRYQEAGKKQASVFLKQLGDAKMSENRVWLDPSQYKVG